MPRHYDSPLEMMYAVLARATDVLTPSTASDCGMGEAELLISQKKDLNH
jgi:hypothetical protein